MERVQALARENLRSVRRIWGRLPIPVTTALKRLTLRFGFSVASGDLRYLDGSWYVTHSGLLALSQANRCCGITIQVQHKISQPEAGRWVFKATVYKSPRSKGFVGYGDADPSNVSPLVRGAEMRVAETRAVNRALRKAYGIGLCSVEELKYAAGSRDTSDHAPRNHAAPAPTSHGNGQPRLRDRLCLLIRQHGLNANMVKRYAASFCDIENLRDARREQVEAFIEHLAEWAARDHEGLLCKLNSYAAPEEVTA